MGAAVLFLAAVVSTGSSAMHATTVQRMTAMSLQHEAVRASMQHEQGRQSARTEGVSRQESFRQTLNAKMDRITKGQGQVGEMMER